MWPENHKLYNSDKNSTNYKLYYSMTPDGQTTISNTTVSFNLQINYIKFQNFNQSNSITFSIFKLIPTSADRHDNQCDPGKLAICDQVGISFITQSVTPNPVKQEAAKFYKNIY